MSLRFLKKKDGTKVLQYKDMASLDYRDIPMVEEETNKDRLMKAISSVDSRYKHGSENLTILLSKKFHECLKMEHNGLYSPCISDITSIMGHRVYIVDTMISDFKILKEL
jgi:hypothetical protein